MVDRLGELDMALLATLDAMLAERVTGLLRSRSQ
jgi:hypothetical protein